MELDAEIEACERAVWEALRLGDGDAEMRLLSPDFLGVYPSGFANRADHASQIAEGPSILTYALDKVQVRAVGPDHALISYRARYTRRGAGEEVMLVSSLWRRQGGAWVNSFSQDTALPGLR